MILLNYKRKDWSPEIIENLTSALVECSNCFKIESIFELCKLGRELCERLVDVFGQRQTTFAAKVKEKQKEKKTTEKYFLKKY